MFDQILWFSTRGAGIVSLLLSTIVVCMGFATVARWQAPGWPRFLTVELHRSIALLSVVFVTIHVVTAILDPFTSLGVLAAIVPLASSYRPVAVALGVISVDLLLAVIITSLVRERIGHRLWRAVHWLAWAAWPMAVLHSLIRWKRRLRAVDAGDHRSVLRRGRRGPPVAPDRGRVDPELARRGRRAVVASDEPRRTGAEERKVMSQRVLAGPPPGANAETLADHERRLGPRPTANGLIPVLDASGLLGRGGAGFPVARKWATVAERGEGRAVVLANGAEGEPLSAKDRAIMTLRPHLVLDGAELAADAVGADRIIVYVGGQHRAAMTALERAIDERAAGGSRRLPRVPIELIDAPPTYVAGEESAAVHYIEAGDARPTTVPPRPFDRGVEVARRSSRTSRPWPTSPSSRGSATAGTASSGRASRAAAPS